jgi:uncharacterized protein (DUF433 family)
MAFVDLFTVEQAACLAGVSPGQVVAWDRDGFFRSTWPSDGKPYGRLYSFRDVVGLRTLAVLRTEHRVPLQDLKRVGQWLSDRYEAPWASLRFYVAGRRVYFDDPSTGMRTAGRPLGQGAFPFEMDAVAKTVSERVAAAKRRQPDQLGRIVQERGMVGNAPVLAGTRIPTSAIWSFHADGYTVEQIIAEYPRLTPTDIEAAILFEQTRRAS